jgi:CheY-like chemotaxis protein
MPLDEPAHPTVLIVEDERISRQAMAYLLEQSGFRSAACESAEEALERLGDEPPPALALIDVDLPGMSGLELIARLEKLRPGLFAILITAAGGERIETFRKAHDVQYIRKPVDFRRLLELLDERRSSDKAGHHTVRSPN